MTPELSKALDDLRPIQREAVEWTKGPALILAGPGAGKTRVLTTRIARILESSRDQHFRILALTFTTKAANEMSERVASLVPGLTERAFIGTFHSFCSQVLRQHGSHIGIRPDFGIYDQEEDREDLLSDALMEASVTKSHFTKADVRWLKLIDKLKAALILPEKVKDRLRDETISTSVIPVYELYEAALRSRNVMDYNGLILEACRLMRDMPAVASRIRRSYLFWLIDEFQDTTAAQYKLLRLMAGEDFKNIYIVADDDQIIYQWAGASYRQIEIFRNQYRPELIQLSENHRCPPAIVEAANRLVAHNTQRSQNKAPIIAARVSTNENSIQVRSFTDDVQERLSLTEEIHDTGAAFWGKTAVLARNRHILISMLQDLKSSGVAAVFAQRRDRFLSPQFVWLQSCLDQCIRPSDKIVFRILVNAANRIGGLDLDPNLLLAEAEAAGLSYLDQWRHATSRESSSITLKLSDLAARLIQSRNDWRKVVKDALPLLIESAKEGDGIITDVEEDRMAWDACMREIKSETGFDPELPEVVQGIALRSKEPPRDKNCVVLTTIHAAKGLEFDFVYVMGAAEEIIPSWQSIKKGNSSPEMEEERRNCFVAITRARERVVLSWAAKYGSSKRGPSRFLREMGFIS